MNRKKILVISLSLLHRDPRVQRQIKALNEDYEVVALGLSDPALDDVIFWDIKPRNRFVNRQAIKALNLLRFYEHAYWHGFSGRQVQSFMDRSKEESFSLIIANDVEALPLAFRIADETGLKVYLDAHEYTPRQFEDRWTWRLFKQKSKKYLCSTYLHKCVGMSTVCESIAKEYSRNYGVSPIVVMNAAHYVDRFPGRVSADRIRLVHHGAATPSRQIEKMIELASLLDERFTMALMLMPVNKNYFSQLQEKAAEIESVRLIPPVPMQQIVSTISEYDIGVILVPPRNLNLKFGLPNKLFEFVQARLAVAIGPSLEMANLVREHGLGVVADDFEPETLAKCLNSLSAEQIESFKENAHRSAKALSFEAGIAGFKRHVAKILESGSRT